MKVSMILTLGIALAGFLAGLTYQKPISAARVHHQQVAAEAQNLGVLPNDIGARSTKRVRSEKSQALRAALVEFQEILRVLPHRENGMPNEALAWESLARTLIERISVLDPSELAMIMREIRDSDEIPAASRDYLFRWILMNLTSYDPSTITKVSVESYNQIKDPIILSDSLARWAEKDAPAATAWLLETSKTHPEMSEDHFKESVVCNIAGTDPRLAFSMVVPLGFKDRSMAVHSIMAAALIDPEDRHEALDALRGHLTGMTREADRVATREAGFAALASGLDGEDFPKSTAWLEGANLSEPELAAFATGLGFSQTGDETRQWIGWLSDHLNMGDLNEPVAELMTDWTRHDYVAAGQWLAAAPESPGKRAAVAAYAETVAGTEPQTAVQWALTLPDTWRREAVMRAIHEKWPASDPQGAAAFAEAQGIK
jgi:hypothetical protein